jgi:pimeloyl-ACP methyl ester carboxylesterase
MWRWTKRTLIGLGSLLAGAALAGAVYQWIATRRDLARNPPPGRLVAVGGHRLHIWCAGSGSPAVVLEAGLGGTTADWGFVQPEIAGFTQVCSYDRAGVGYSDPGPSPRTARRIAGELARLLERAHVAAPVVVVAASIGGLSARVFASEHPDQVAGLVLVDASHEDQDAEVPAIAPLVPLLAATGAFRLLGVTFGPAVASLPPNARGRAVATGSRTSAYRAAVDELRHFPQSAAEVKTTRRPLAIPLVVVTAGLGSDDRWRELQRDQVALSSRGCQLVAERSGHAVPLGDPDTVVRAVRFVVDAVNRHRASPVRTESAPGAPQNSEIPQCTPPLDFSVE